MNKTPPLVPSALSLNQALQASQTLNDLRARIQMSERCLGVVRATLGPDLGQHLRAGPFTDGSWTLFSPHAALAAKLRQLLPRIQSALVREGLAVSEVRVKIFRPQ
jgi:hypothetical protein